MTIAQYNELQRQAEEIEKHQMYSKILVQATDRFVEDEEIDAFIKGAYWMLNELKNQ